MSDYTKYLVEQIQKYGQGVPTRSKGPKVTAPVDTPAPAPAAKPAAPAASGGTPAPATKPSTSAVPTRGKSAPTRAPAGQGYTSDPRILKMQEQMVTLSKWVLSQINIADIAKTDALREAGEAAHRGSFGDFIVKNYLRPSDKGAKEFDPSHNVTDVKKKQPSTPTRMLTIMDTISRIGGGKAEDAPDGKWGPRTNQSLLNIRAFAKAMLKLAADFGVKIESYSQADLNQLNGLPENDTDWTPQKKGEMAPVIGQHIRAITNMFHEIKENILEKPEHQAFIEGDKPYATIGKGSGKPGQQPEQPPQPLSQQAITSMQNRFRDGFPVLFTDVKTNKEKTILIFVADLMSPDALQGWMYKHQTNLDPSKLIDQVKDRLQGHPIRPVPPRYEDTMSPSDREQFFKRNPDIKKQHDTEVAEENSDLAKQEEGMRQQRNDMAQQRLNTVGK